MLVLLLVLVLVLGLLLLLLLLLLFSTARMLNALAADAHQYRTTRKCRTSRSCDSPKSAGPWAVTVVAAETAHRRLGRPRVAESLL